MTKISQFPQSVWRYETWRSDFDISLEEDLRAMKIMLPEQILEQLTGAVKKWAIAQLPEWFQGRRCWNNPDIIELYTTRQAKKTKI